MKWKSPEACSLVGLLEVYTQLYSIRLVCPINSPSKYISLFEQGLQLNEPSSSTVAGNRINPTHTRRLDKYIYIYLYLFIDYTCYIAMFNVVRSTSLKNQIYTGSIHIYGTVYIVTIQSFLLHFVLQAVHCRKRNRIPQKAGTAPTWCRTAQVWAGGWRGL